MRYDRATADLDPPLAIVDLGAFDRNAADMTRRAALAGNRGGRGGGNGGGNGARPIRVATKSLRCRYLIERALATPGYRGVMCYSLPEALWLHAAGTSDDLLVAYPTVDRRALRALAADGEARRHITIMTDSPAHLDVVDRALGDGHPEIRVCLDLDVSWRPLGRRPAVHIGTRRSPLHTPEQAAGFARAITRRAGFSPGRRDGVRGPDRRAGRRTARAPAQGSADQADPGPFGPGTGPPAGRDDPPHPGPDHPGLCQRRRDRQPGVDRAGRVGDRAHGGFRLVGPTLFDAYRRFAPEPALLFALPVVRRPGPGIATLFSGGYVASGTGTPDRLPRPYLPAGCPSPASRSRRGPDAGARRGSRRPATGFGCVTPRPANSPSASASTTSSTTTGRSRACDVPG